MAKNIEVTLTLNDRGFSRKADSAQRQIARLGSTSKTSTGAIAGLAARFAAIAAPIVAATAAFRGLSDALAVSAEFEKTQVTLSNIIGSAEGGKAAFDALREVALELPIAFNELSSAAPALATVSKDINELEKNTRLAADIAANFGIPFETAAGQLQRAFSAGAGAADVFREKGVLAAAGFEAGVSYSVDETIAKIREFGGEIEGASEQLNTTFAGAVNQAGDAFEIFQESIGAIILPEAQAFLEGLIDSFRDNKAAVLEFGTAIGTNVVKGIKAFAMGIATAIDIGLSMAQTMKRIAQAIRENFGEQIRIVANAVVKAFGGIVEGISLVGVGIGKLISATTGVTDVEDFFNNINEAANRVRREGLTAIEEVGEGMATFIPVTTARDTVNNFIDIVDTGAQAIRDKKAAVDEAAQSIGGDLPIALSQATSALANFRNEFDLLGTIFGPGGILQTVTGRIEPIHIPVELDIPDVGIVEDLIPLFSVEQFKETLQELADDLGVVIKEVDVMPAVLGGLKDAFTNTVMSAKDYADIQRTINDLLEEGLITLPESIELYKQLDEAFADQEGMRNFLQTLSQAQVALSQDLATAFLEGENAGKAFQDFFKKMITQIIADILRLQIIQPLLTGLFGLQFGAGGAVTGMNFGGSFFGGIFGKAGGGSVMRDRPYIVGERGPELFVPGQSGGIVPNGAMGQQVTYNINAVDAASFKAMVAKDPEFLFNVTQMGARRVPS